MSNECCIIIDSWGTDEVSWAETERKVVTATKEFICDECGGAIPIGTRYEFSRYDVLSNEDDSIVGKRHLHTCLPCAQIRQDYFCNSIYGGLIQATWEYLGFNYITGEMNPDFMEADAGNNQ